MSTPEKLNANTKKNTIDKGKKGKKRNIYPPRHQNGRKKETKEKREHHLRTHNYVYIYASDNTNEKIIQGGLTNEK